MDQMSSPIPARITIDFRQAILPSRSWIVGELSGPIRHRVELITLDDPHDARSGTQGFVPPASVSSDCRCPEFCERDHANV
jgi:hypothetical protein